LRAYKHQLNQQKCVTVKPLLLLIYIFELLCLTMKVQCMDPNPHLNPNPYFNLYMDS
jgi:hypothetical protein